MYSPFTNGQLGECLSCSDLGRNINIFQQVEEKAFYSSSLFCHPMNKHKCKFYSKATYHGSSVGSQYTRQTLQMKHMARSSSAAMGWWKKPAWAICSGSAHLQLEKCIVMQLVSFYNENVRDGQVLKVIKYTYYKLQNYENITIIYPSMSQNY